MESSTPEGEVNQGVPAGITLEAQGIQGPAAQTLLTMVDVFEDMLNLVARKSVGYGDAWQRQGWMGNLARIQSKSDRLKSLLWHDKETVDPVEAVDDTLLDLANLAVFMRLNRVLGNKWGERR